MCVHVRMYVHVMCVHVCVHIMYVRVCVCMYMCVCTYVYMCSSTGELKILTKGDNNYGDDRIGQIFANGQNWVTKDEIIGRARG